MEFFIHKLPFPLLIVMTALIKLERQFSVPEPHLVEKMRMLAEGTLTKPLDIFDVFGTCCRRPWLSGGVRPLAACCKSPG